ncbi:MAG: DUF1573 domain-containing protein [Phycisphaerales bacterium]
MPPLACALLTMALTLQSSPPPAGPVGRPMQSRPMPADMVVRAEPQGLDYGIVPPYTTLQAEFHLVNSGDRPLKVLQAVPSCQCTTVDIVGKQIPPRGTLAVPVTMKVSSTGKKSADVKVLVEGQPRPITLDLRAEVAYAVRATVADADGVEQPYVDAFKDPQRLRGVTTVSSTDGKPFRVLSVQGVPVNDDTPRNSHRVDFALVGEPCESVPKYMVIETDRADARLIDVRVRHACTRITPGLDIAEFRSNAGVIASGGAGEFEMELKKMGSNRVGSVESMDPRFRATLLDQRADGSAVMARVRLEPVAGTSGVFLIPVRLRGVTPEGRPYMVQRPEPAQPGSPARMQSMPAEADVMVYGKVE